MSGGIMPAGAAKASRSLPRCKFGKKDAEVSLFGPGRVCLWRERPEQVKSWVAEAVYRAAQLP